jgi:hypothetical protein
LAPCSILPSTGGSKMRAQVPFSDAPVTTPSKLAADAGR